MKNIKNILISFLTAITTIVVIYGGYSTFAEEPYSFESDEIKMFGDACIYYHSDMSDYFNEKFKAAYDLMKNKKDFFESENRKLLEPPSEEDITSCNDYISPCDDKIDNDKDGKIDKDDDKGGYNDWIKQNSFDTEDITKNPELNNKFSVDNFNNVFTKNSTIEFYNFQIFLS